MVNKKINIGWIAKINQFFKSEGKIKWIVLIGIVGMILILLSELFTSKDNNKETNQGEITVAQYIAQTEQKMEDLISSIEGVGKLKIMVTLENGIEYVYVEEGKTTTDVTQDNKSSDVTRTTQKDNSENKIVMVENANGKKQALVQKALEPAIKGVVVVCEGGGNIQVEERVTKAITTAFAISSNRVCVTKLK